MSSRFLKIFFYRFKGKVLRVINKNKKLKEKYEFKKRNEVLPKGILEHLNKEQRRNYDTIEKNGRLSCEFRLEGGDDFPDRTFFVIRRMPSSCGIMQHYDVYVFGIMHALDMGYVPVIDMQTYRNSYHNIEDVGIINTWEYYFEQPMGVSLERALKGRNLIMSDAYNYDYIDSILNKYGITGKKDREAFPYKFDDGVLDIFKHVTGEYMRVKKEIIDEADKIYCNETKGDKSVLGIALRGAGYSDLKPYGHPVQPSFDVVLEDALDMIKKYNITKVYLSGADKDIIDYFSSRLGIPTFWHHRHLYEKGEEFKKQRGQSDKYQSGKDYLISILMLKKTNYLLAARMGSTYAAILSSNSHWKEKYIYDLGYYK